MNLEHVLVAGGGSGGHVFPALAVAEILAGKGWRLSWLGRAEGMEKNLVQRNGLDYYGLPAMPVVGRSTVQRAAALAQAVLSSLRARRLIRRLRVGAVLGTGGYASVPGVLGARLARRPVVLLEPNAIPGFANRCLSRWSSVAAVATAQAGECLHCRSVTTGVPVRSEFSACAESPATTGPLHVLILGGSQGARQLNQLLPSALERLAPNPAGIRVTHQVGVDLLEQARETYREHSLKDIEVQLVSFLEDMAGTMAAAHLVVSRAGAVTLAEICAVGRAALLLPLSLAGSHQFANAARLVETGGAEMLSPTQVTAPMLADRMGSLLRDRQRLMDMGRALRGLARPEAAAKVAALVEEATGAK